MARLRLHVSIDGAAHRVAFDRAVRVEMSRGTDPKANESLQISWQPEGSTVLPTFKGTVVVWGESPNLSYVELDGEYMPPFGAAGQNFDALISNRLAHATARSLLADLRRCMEGRPQAAG